MNEMLRPLRSADDLVVAGLVPEAARAGVARVDRRYAIALTPAIADLIDRADPNDPSRETVHSRHP